MVIQEHLSKQYDSELDGVRTRVLEMGGLVEAQILKAIQGLTAGDPDIVEQVEMGDHLINGLEVSIDLDCAHIIARRQPAAGDLRLIMAISKMVTDLERIGDEATKVARMSVHLHERPRMLPLQDIRDMGEIAVRMLRAVLDAFARLDSDVAADIVREDKEIDVKFHGLMRQLITFMMEDPRTISLSLDLVLIAKAIERIGDHATNMAEQVIYIVKGTDVRHVSVDQWEGGVHK